MRGAIFFLLLLFFLTACQTDNGNQSSPEAATATPPPAATSTQTPTAVPTPTPSATTPPTMTAVPTSAATLTPTPEPAPTIDRTCPTPAPEKPEYSRGATAPSPWPTPDTAAPSPHFWLRDPIADGRKPFEQSYYPYGWDSGGRFLLHNGADMTRALGTPVLAVASGTVIVAGADTKELYGWRCNWYGLLVIIELDEQWQGQPVYILYGHIQNIQVEPGQRVEPGDIVAEIGVEGVSLIPHLHLEVRVGTNTFGSTRNPLLWLEPFPETGVLAGRVVDEAGRPWQGIRLTLIDTSGEETEFISTFSYLGDPQNLVHPDEALAENFVFADMPPGNYTLFAKIAGIEYRMLVEIEAGEITTATIVTKKPQGED
ncbi:MAG TPA: hypothetical protein EYH05_19070 [Anaerolineae bacterium]|nr:hypothetical protein [Anaerolineae bacterium]